QVVRAALVGSAFDGEERPQIAFVEDLEAGWYDAGDEVGFAVELQGAANQGRVGGKAVAPHALGNHYDVAAPAVVVFSEHAAGDGADAENAKEVDGDGLAG